MSVIRSACVVDTKTVKHLKCAKACPMYQPSVACGAHVLRWCGFLCIIALHPKLANGVASKLKCPSIASCAKISGFCLHSLSILLSFQLVV